MDILEFALEKERLSRDYYQSLVDKTSHPGLKKIFGLLVEQENEHCGVIEQLRSHVSPSMTETEVLRDAKDVFQEIKESGGEFDFSASEIEVYRMARDKELKSMEFYVDKAREAENSAMEKVFLALADEERKHYTVLDNICDFVSEPECYLEDAEFVHIEGYPA